MQPYKSESLMTPSYALIFCLHQHAEVVNGETCTLGRSAMIAPLRILLKSISVWAEPLVGALGPGGAAGACITGSGRQACALKTRAARRRFAGSLSE